MKDILEINCWEFLRCGRNIGGKNSTTLGHCISAISHSFNGINGGINAGRYCWAVAGSFSEEEPMCVNLDIVENCTNCSFYKLINEEII